MADSTITRGTANDLAIMYPGSYGKSGDVLDHILYDNLPFAATTMRPTSNFFTTPIGGQFGAVVKTLNETNMTDPGKLPMSQSFLIKEIGFAFNAFMTGAEVDAVTILQDFYNIMRASIFEVRIAGRSFDFQSPGGVFLPAISQVARGTLVAATDAPVRVGDFLASGWIKLATPIVLGEMVSFSVVQQSGSAVAAIQTILNTASTELNTQNAQLEMRLKGTLARSK